MKLCARCKTNERVPKYSYCLICRSLINKEWAAKHRVSKAKYHRLYFRELRRQAVAKLGDKCKHCGITDLRLLQIDHVDGGGGKELKKIGVYGIYCKILKGDTKGYQLLCANCNWLKRHEENEVPYAKEKT